MKNSSNPKSEELIQSPKGMHDILPDEEPWWEKVRNTTKSIADFYNFQRIDTPILESVDLFLRSIGEATDIVEKEMFVLKTKGKDHLALRPEGTAGVVRAYFEHGMSHLGQPVKLYYIGPMFRYEHPQAGRYRQHHQVGFEILGANDDPIYDAQSILTFFRLVEDLKIKNLVLHINSIGCKVCRPQYKKKLQEYYKTKQNKICKDCKRRLVVNPLRLLDCKNEICQPIKAEAPVIIDYLCQACRNHFREILEYIDDLALPYVIDSYLVRGLDYYNRTVFELFAEGNNLALGGGGRYDYLGEMLGARKSPLPATGWSVGIERLVEVMKIREIPGAARAKARVFLIQIGKPAKRKAVSLIEDFRRADFKVIEALGKDSLTNQLKVADKENVELALILGQREVFEDSIIIRDMKSGSQEAVPVSKVVEEVKRRMHQQ